MCQLACINSYDQQLDLCSVFVEKGTCVGEGDMAKRSMTRRGNRSDKKMSYELTLIQLFSNPMSCA